MTRIHAITKKFVQEGDVYHILLEILDAAISISSAEKATIQRPAEGPEPVNIIASRGVSEDFLKHFNNYSYGSNIFDIILQQGKPILIEDITASSIFSDARDLQLFWSEGIRAIQITPIKNHTGKILAILSTYHTRTPIVNSHSQMLNRLGRMAAEIIESGQWVRERAKSIEILREANRRKDNFLAMLSHELRNPLAAISNSSFILSRTSVGSESAQRAHATIERQLYQINRLVDDLLDVTRIAQNKIQLRQEYSDVNELVLRTAEDHRFIFESLNIGIRVTLPEKPVVIYADPTRVSQIVGNLLQNAAKFSLPEGIIKVFIKLEEHFVAIQIVDDGIGISPDLLEGLFDPFMQIERSLDRSQGGLGLGLALVKGLAELHGGDVNVKSQGEGMGTAFTVRLPLHSKALIDPLH